jgi:histidinol-phosphatase (PHP family)
MLNRPWPADHHVHSRFSDGSGEPSELVARAAALGMREVGIADHLALGPYNDEPGYSIDTARLDEYLATVRAAGADHPGLRVLAAIEVDYTPDTIDEAARLLRAHRFDYAIGSLHFVDGQVVDTRSSLHGALWVDVDTVFRRYFELVAEVASSGLFDVIGHLDLPKKYGHRPRDPAAVEPALTAALDAIAAAGVAIELNTSGWRRPMGEAYPSPEILAAAAAREIPLVLGSDAHRPDDVGADFERALAAAAAAGYATLLRLSDGEREAIG